MSSAGLVVTGAVIVGGLLLVSVLLYLLDTWATARIDDMLRSHEDTKGGNEISQYLGLYFAKISIHRWSGPSTGVKEKELMSHLSKICVPRYFVDTFNTHYTYLHMFMYLLYSGATTGTRSTAR